MARSIERTLAALKQWAPGVPLDTIRSALATTGTAAGVAVAAAAKVCEGHGLRDLAPELVEAFTALGAPKSDPGCRGRIAIVHALHALGHWADEVFTAGLSIVQRVGSPSAPDDEAAPLRGACALAHAHFLRPDAVDVCAEMLADAWIAARIGAARGLGDSGRTDAAAVLRYKLVLATDDGDVLAACFDAWFALDREGAIAFARKLLGFADERADAAALALGGNRAAVAIDDLIAWCRTCEPRRRQRVGYVALALLRHEAANAVLAQAIAEQRAPEALAAATALATFRDEASTAELLRAAAAKQRDRQLRAELLALV